MRAAPPPRHRAAFWTSVLVAVALTAAGTSYAVAHADAAPGPAATVRAYFAALQSGDAPTALAYGDVPAGPTDLLTSTVLRTQRRLAPIIELAVGVPTVTQQRASVEVAYTLAYAGAPQQVSDTITLHRRGSRWRLDASAVTTELHLPAAIDRASVLGGPVPSGDTLLFPGAVPVSFDTPLLQVRPDAGSLRFDGPPTTLVFAQVTAAGTRMLTDAVRTSLDDCYGPQSTRRPACPLPSGRYVPGAVRGTVDVRPDELTVEVATEPTGQLTIGGQVRVTGRWAKLGFTNQLQTGTGTLAVPVQGSAYPSVPLRVTWTPS